MTKEILAFLKDCADNPHNPTDDKSVSDLLKTDLIEKLIEQDRIRREAFTEEWKRLLVEGNWKGNEILIPSEKKEIKK
jgi:hypothetical protein